MITINGYPHHLRYSIELTNEPTSSTMGTLRLFAVPPDLMESLIQLKKPIVIELREMNIAVDVIWDRADAIRVDVLGGNPFIAHWDIVFGVFNKRILQ